MFGHYYAATEVPIVIEYDPDTLETLGRFDLGKIISDVRLITAHPLYESDGTMWNIASATGLDSKGKEGSRMEGTLNFDSFDLGANF